MKNIKNKIESSIIKHLWDSFENEIEDNTRDLFLIDIRDNVGDKIGDNIEFEIRANIKTSIKTINEKYQNKS